MVYSLCIPFRYFFSFRSNIVYLSLGTISRSIGISSFHNSTALVFIPCFASASSTVAMTASTARRRLRWRAFCGAESRHGIFLVARSADVGLSEDTASYQRRPPDSGDVGLNAPNIVMIGDCERLGYSSKLEMMFVGLTELSPIMKAVWNLQILPLLQRANTTFYRRMERGILR